MIHRNRWSPDTCGCKFDFSWDDSVPDIERVHTFERVEATCPEHTLQTGEPLYVQSLTENRRKNVTSSIVKTLLTDLDSRTEYQWEFTSERLLIVTVPRLTNPQVSTLQSAIDVQFGPNVVELRNK